MWPQRRWARFLAAAVAGIFIGGVAGCARSGETAGVPIDEPGVAQWIDESGLHTTGFGEASFETLDGIDLKARIYRSSSFDTSNGPIWFVMHGASRDAERYIRAAAPVAERYDAMAIVIHFTRSAYPKGSDYTLGVTRNGWNDRDSWGRIRWRDPQSYLYAEVERVFDAVLGSLDGNQEGYFLFGHSAGAQFVHRLLTFLPEPRVRGAVAANAGWYTLPTVDNRAYTTMPYGLNGTPVEPEDLRGFFGTPFVVLLGENDTATAATDDLVRGTPEAEAQGANRLERGKNYFGVGEEQARNLDAEFAWRLKIVPRAGHDAARVIHSAGFLMFAADASTCPASTAAEASGLVITEILADPPPGEAGDANGDGVRDPSDDEFVEIVNAGTTPVCLAGWTLGDAKSADRHVFPLGQPLAPGQTLIVFGGGVPTGRFDGAEIQWSRRGLSLSNDGDVLTLRDAEDRVVHQVSWGDAAGEPRAEDHWPDELGIRGSLVRSPESGADWSAHPEIDGFRFSPGLVVGDTFLNE